MNLHVLHNCRANSAPVGPTVGPTVGVADPWAEVRGRGYVLPVGRLKARLLLFLLLLVPLLRLALAHPAWGQKDGVIGGRYSTYRWK